jgi:myosin-5
MKERGQSIHGLAAINEDDKFQFGITKIFFRAGVVAYLEKLRGDRMKHAIVMMQRNARRYVVRAQHVRQMTAIAAINRYARGMLARREAQVCGAFLYTAWEYVALAVG